nr:sensor domain-containing diguanylate cyclase [Kineosporia babensis]
MGARTIVFLATALAALGFSWMGLEPLRNPGAGQPAWWPLAAFGAALLVYSPSRWWPAIVAGIALGSTTSVLVLSQTVVNYAGLTAGLCENLLVAVLLRRLRPRQALEERLIDAVRVLICLLVASTVASVVFALLGSPGDRTALGLWSEFVRNHVLALMLIGPCLVVHLSRGEVLAQLRDHRRNLEWLAQLAATMSVAALLFLTYQRVVSSTLLVLPLIWGATRLGALRATISLLASALIITLGTNHGLGRIALLDRSAEELLTLQTALATLSLVVIATSISARLRERATNLLRQRTQDLNTAERLAGLGSVRWDPTTDAQAWSDGLHLLLGADPAKVRPSAAVYDTFVHPEDLPRVRADGERIRNDMGNAEALEYRIVRTDGDVRTVAIQTVIERAPGGVRDQVFATVQDVTQARAAAAEVTKAHAELAAVLNAVTGTAILGTNGKDGRISFFNIGAERMFGYRAEEVIGRMRALDLHDQADFDGQDPGEEILAAVRAHGTYSAQRNFVRQDGSRFPGQLTITSHQGSDDRPLGFIGVITDLTGVLQAQEELAESEKRFRLAFDTSPMGMAVVSLAPAEPGRFLRVNDALCEFAGVGEAVLLGSTVGDFLGDGEHLQEAMANLVAMMNGSRDSVTVDRHLYRPDGGERWGKVSASAVRPGRGRDPYLILLVEDITARKALTERLQHEAAHDSLTGLPNRLHLHRQLERELQERDSGGSVAVLYLDLDGFKAVNDSQGHGAGDELLVQVADRIAASVRSGDVVARLGGDEFAVLCPGIPDVETAMRTGRRILAALSLEFDLSQTRARVGASIGVAVAVEGDTGPELLHAADQAMYAAKREGKGVVRLNAR